MLALAMDTATPWGRFAVADGDGVLADQSFNLAASAADVVLPVVTDLLARVDRQLAEVTVVGVSRGPGSFTGVRVGVATAKALAYALGARLVAVSTLAAMAAALLDEEPAAELAIPALDARRGEIFAAIYRRCDGWVDPVVEPAALAPDDWWQRVIETAEDLNGPVYGGDGVPLLVGQGASLRAELQSEEQLVRRAWSTNHPPTARALARALVTPELALPTVHPFELNPLYLRQSDAETKRRIDLTPAAPNPDVQVHPPRAAESGNATEGQDPRDTG